MPRFLPSLVLLAFGGALTDASAHHSFAVFFDSSKSITVTGVVAKFHFTNPHGILRLTVKNKDGTEEHWKAETNSPSILRRHGWTKESLKTGEKITIEGWPARDGSKYLRLRKAIREDGTPIGSLSSPTLD